MKTRVDDFLKYYKQLEEAVASRYQKTIYEVAQDELVSFNKILNSLRRLRNLIQHSKENLGRYIAEPDEYAISTLKDILKLVDRSIVFQYMVPIEQILHAKLSDRVFDYVAILVEKKFSHLPIIDDTGMVKYIFKATSFLELAAKGVFPSENTTFSEIKEYLDIGCFQNEILFVSQFDSILEITALCRKQFYDNNYISIILVTENGKQDEPLLGLITPIGLISKYVG